MESGKGKGENKSSLARGGLNEKTRWESFHPRSQPRKKSKREEKEPEKNEREDKETLKLQERGGYTCSSPLAKPSSKPVGLFVQDRDAYRISGRLDNNPGQVLQEEKEGYQEGLG